MMTEFFAAAALIGVAFYVHRYGMKNTSPIQPLVNDASAQLRPDSADVEETPAPQKPAQKIVLQQASIGALPIPFTRRV
jgi:hypothetical protein